jgi:hypothetical protein
MKRILFFVLFFNFIFFSTQVYAGWDQKPTINIYGFVDIFYVYDFNEPVTNYRQPFFYNHNRHNEFNLNLGLISLQLLHPKYRANLSIQAGTYPNDNYAAEPGVLKNIYEAVVGISLNNENNLWLDAGIMASHIGFESAISIENFTLTRSLSAENSPYFLTGAKLTFSPGEKWELAAIVCNGWQRIQRVQNNSLLSFGTQVNYSPNEEVILNWSTFVGTDDPDSTRRMRYFNNFYSTFNLSKEISFIAGFDIGLQQRSKGSSEYDAWLSPVIIAQYSLNQNWKTAFRAEYYKDKTGIIIPTGTENGFETTGFSVNCDYLPVPNLAVRMEGRWLISRDKIFETNNGFSDQDFFIASSISIKIVE